MLGAVQFSNTLDADRTRTSPFDLCSHFGQQFSEINNLRFQAALMMVVVPSASVAAMSTFSVTSHGHHLELDLCATQSSAFASTAPPRILDLRPHLFERPEMEVNRPLSNRTTARKTDSRVPVLRNQRSQDEN
jgi:hypothetical protein